MSGRMRALIRSCVAVLVIGGAAMFTHGSPAHAHAHAKAIRVADVDRAVAPRRSAPSAVGGSSVCFVGESSTSGQACGEAACTEFIDAAPTVPGSVPPGAECRRVTTPVIPRGSVRVWSPGTRSDDAAAPTHGTLRSRLRVFVQHLSR